MYLDFLDVLGVPKHERETAFRKSDKRREAHRETNQSWRRRPKEGTNQSWRARSSRDVGNLSGNRFSALAVE